MFAYTPTLSHNNLVKLMVLIKGEEENATEKMNKHKIS
jgi:hypothetical protein